MMHTRWKYSTFFALLVNICIAVLINKITKIRRATFVKSNNCCLTHKPFTVNVSQNEVLSVSFLPSVKQQNKSYCCGATVGSEQQHNQDLKEIYKGR